jgi:hypothetical protein
MKATHLFLETNKAEFIANKAIRAIEAQVEHPVKIQADRKAMGIGFPSANQAIGSINMLRKIATLEGFFMYGTECSISMN